MLKFLESDLFPKLLIIQYLLAMFMYLWTGSYAKSLYWLGATIIVWSVILM